MMLHRILSRLGRAIGFPRSRRHARRLLKTAWNNRLQFEPFEQRQLFSVTPAGPEYRVNTYTVGNQKTWLDSPQAVAADDAGNYVVTWSSMGQDGDIYGVYAQRYNHSGLPQGSEFRVNSYTTGHQRYSTVAMDSDGDFVITWTSHPGQDGDGYGVYAQRFNTSGVAQGSEFRVNSFTTGNQYASTVAMDSSGNFVIVWNSATGQDGSSEGVYARRFNALGIAQGSEFRVNTHTTNFQRFATVAMDSDGDFLVAWQSYLQDGDFWGIFAQRFNASGVAQGSEFRINSYTTGWQTFPAVAMSVDGDFMVSWSGAGAGDSYGIYGRRFNSSGIAQGSEFRINTYTTNVQRYSTVAIDPDGGFMAVWTGEGGQDGDGHGIYYQRYDSSGVAQGSETRVNTYTTSLQYVSSVAMDADGDFVVVWQSIGQDASGYGIYAQRFNDDPAQVTEVRVAGDPTPIDPSERLVSVIAAGPSLQATFDRTMSQTGGAAGANSVTNPANWALSRDGADLSSQITAVTFSGFVATLTLSSSLTGGEYVLTAKQSIVDIKGDLLDGDANGAPGGDFSRSFKISPPVAMGGEFRVNTYTTGTQRTWEDSTQSVAMDAVGNFVVTWTSVGQDGSNEGVYAQRYSSSGAARGSEFRVNTHVVDKQQRSSVAMDAVGNFVVTWTSFGQDGDEDGIYAQRISAAGAALGSEFRVNSFTTSRELDSVVAMDADGDFVVVWSSMAQDGNSYGIYAQRFNAAGAPQGSEFRVNTYTYSGQENAAVAMDADGDFVVTWGSTLQNGSTFDIYAQRFNALGVMQGSEFRANSYTTSNQRWSTVAMDADGDFVISWTSVGQDGDFESVHAQRFNSSGTPQGSQFQVNSYTTSHQVWSTVAMDDDGDFVVTWTSQSQDLLSYGVYAQRFSAGGVAQGSEFRVNTYRPSSQFYSRIAMDDDGDFVVAWTSDGQDGSGYGIYAQRYFAPVPSTSIALDALSNLVIADVSVGGQDDSLTIKFVAASSVYVISDPNQLLSTTIPGASGNGTSSITIPATAVTGPQISVLTLEGNDSLTIDFSQGNFPKTIFYDGGNQTTSDKLTLTGGSFASVAHAFAGPSSGNISITSNALVSYTGLEPIFDNLNAINRVFTLPSGSASTATLADDGVSANGLSRLSAATFERVDFVNPTGSLTINRGQAGDSLTIGNLPDFNASLTIGSVGNEFSEITFAGNVTLASNKNLNAFATGTISLPNVSSDLATTGGGSLSLITKQNFTLALGSSITTANGNLTLSANQQPVPTSGSFVGININQATVQVTGSGNLSLAGRGGNIGEAQYGIQISDTGRVRGGATGKVELAGTGGAAAGNFNYGVNVADANSQISSNGANLIITGQGSGSASSSGSNLGVMIAGQVNAGGTGAVVVQGTGGASGGSNHGVVVLKQIISSGGNLTVIGQGGGSAGSFDSNTGVQVSGQIIAGGMASVVVQGTGGASAGGGNDGVVVNSGNITSSGGNVSVSGQGGSNGSRLTSGVVIGNAGKISAGGQGNVTVNGTGGATPGSFNDGVHLTGTNTQISSSGGNVTVIGQGGGEGASGDDVGVFLGLSSRITAGGAGEVLVHGTGGAGTGDFNYGVTVFSAGGQITSSGGRVTVIGQGGGAGAGSENFGLYVLGQISAGGAADVVLQGTGGITSGDSNYGIVVANPGGRVTSSGGNVQVTGIEGAGSTARAIYVDLSGSITTATSGGNITLVGNSVTLGSTVSASSNHRVTLRPYSSGVGIDLGSTNDPVGGPLGLTNDELNNITSGTIQIGNATSGAITVSGNIAHSTSSNFALVSGDNIVFSPGSLNTGGGNLSLTPGAAAGVRPISSGTDVTTSGNATLSFGVNAELAFAINGPTANSQYHQLKVDGKVDLTGVDLALSGSYVPVDGQAFTLIDNDGTDAIVGTFNNLPEGALVNLNGVSRRITYVGGSNNDVVLEELPLKVMAITPTPSGFVAEFNRPFDPSVLNLFDQSGALGAADVALLNSNLEAVRGSIVVDPGLQKFTFIKSGSALAPDFYTLTLTSGAGAFKTPFGSVLDGNADGVPDGNYTGNFTISAPAPNAVTLSAPDFTRGYSQPANLPSGIPITISTGQGISGADFQLRYDPTLLNITGVTAGPEITGSVGFSIPTLGTLVVTISSATELGSQPGPLTLVNLVATVPADALYSAKELLDLTNVHVYDASIDPLELPTIADDGIHVAAYFGDANGSQTYNSPDATLAQRIIVGTNTGLSAYPMADPYLIVDITANGAIQSNDITLIQRAIVGTPTTQIPPHPGLSLVASGGPDPLVYIPQNLSSAVGDSISVPVQLLVTESTGITLAGADLAIAYDASVLQLDEATAGELMVGFGLSVNTTSPGVIRVSLSGGAPLELAHLAAGELIDLHFTVIGGAGSTSNLNLLAASEAMHTALYDDLGQSLKLMPAPTDAANDLVDGRLQIRTSSLAEHAAAVDIVLRSELD